MVMEGFIIIILDTKKFLRPEYFFSLVRRKTMKLLVDIAKVDWPHFYPDFFPQMLQLIHNQVFIGAQHIWRVVCVYCFLASACMLHLNLFIITLGP